MDKLIVLPRARSEADNSAAWYDEHAENLGEKFLDDFEAGLNAIMNAPLRHPEIKGHYRQRLMDGFPFFIVYRINQQKGTVTITSVFHTSRNPKKKFGYK